jgi:hypothetical protein
MKKMIKPVICVVALFMATALPAQAQKGDTTLRRNTIKLDLTSYWLYRDAIVFSYERVVKNKPYQTWAVTAGIQEFPALLGQLSDTVAIKRQNKSYGYKFGGEYRFYLKKENKYHAPRGVFIGPYTSYHLYSNARAIEVNNNGDIQNGELETRLNILNLGVQLGYQFVLNNRWTIDLVLIGPSVSNYKFKAKVNGDFDFDMDQITNEVLLDLMERYPGFKDLITEGEFVSEGKVDKWAYGYRYQLQVGYHFGRKKK